MPGPRKPHGPHEVNAGGTIGPGVADAYIMLSGIRGVAMVPNLLLPFPTGDHIVADGNKEPDTERPSTVQITTDGAVAILTLNNPPANAIGFDIVRDLWGALNEVEGDPSVRVVVVTGAGSMFSAGADVNALASPAGSGRVRMLNDTVDLFERLEYFPKPIVAAVNGFCLGGGNELAMSCDIRIASSKARFGQPEINLGVTPGWGGTQRLTRIIGKVKALEILLTGRMVGAEEAHLIGLTHEVVSEEELMPRATAVAHELAKKAPLAVAEIKRRVMDGADEPPAKSVREDMKGFVKLLGTEDGKEGIAAFLEKRPPNFVGR